MKQLLACVVLMLVGGRAFANGEAVNGFPNWNERVMHEWTNRARCAPQIEMQACGADCSEGGCYTPKPPLPWSEALNHAARFHSDEMAAQGYFDHDSICTLVSNIDSIYPGTCMGAASCACMGGTVSCSAACTAWNSRIGLFGANAAGEIIAPGPDPSSAFYQWLYEFFDQTTCAFVPGPPTNGHRWNILMSGPAVGYGVGNGASVGDFGGNATTAKVVSGSHYPRLGASVDAWANWYDTAGPMQALINVDGTCTAMTLGRGSVTNGAYHAQLSGLAAGCHRYFFLFHDSTDAIVTYPTTGSLGIGAAGTCADWDTTRPTTGAGCSCIAQCAGKQCGDDGCGGSCGNCATGETCPANACVGAAPPDGGTGDDAPGGANNGNPRSGCGCATRDGGPAWLLALLGMLALVSRPRRSSPRTRARSGR